MKLIDYIKGTRRGREANAIEREAMVDPFLADAIEGYDSVYGSHSDVISGLEDKIAKRALRKRKVKPVPEHDDNGGRQKRPHDDTRTESAPEDNGSRKLHDRQKPKRHYMGLMWSAAALFVVAAMGLVWYLSNERPAADELHRVVAMDISDITTPDMVPAAEAMEQEPLVLESETQEDAAATQVQSEKEATLLAQQQLEQKLLQQQEEQRRQQLQREQQQSQAVQQVAVAAPQPQQVLTDVLTVVENSSEIDMADLVFADEDEGIIIVEEIAAESVVGSDNAKTIATRGSENIAEALSGQVADLNIEESAATADNAQTAALNLPDTVTNEAFMQYFRENSKLLVNAEGERTSGSVTVEFRVNDRGVPSAIQIVSGFSAETNHEVIDLLVGGPRWTPTKGKRVRMVIKYE